MSASTVTLAELVNRGILAINDSQTVQNTRAAPVRRVYTANEIASAPIAARPDAKSPEYRRIVESADRLVEKIRNVGTLNDDPSVLRRHILQSLELFLTDISSKP